MTSLSQSEVSAIVALVLVVFLVARRTILSVRGASLTSGRLAFTAGFVVVFFVLAISVELFVLPWYVLPVEAAVVAAAALVGAAYVRPRVQIEERTPGQWYYRLGPLVPIVYLALFVTRIALDFLVLNTNPFAESPLSPTSISPTGLYVLLAIDLLFAASTGLVVGRSLGVYQAWRLRRASPAAAAPLRSA